jgi:hypothetical protein
MLHLANGLELTASVEDDSIDDPFTLASPTSSTRYKATARWRWSNGLSLAANYRNTDVDNDVSDWLADTAPVRDVEIAERFVIATFSRRLPSRRLREFLLESPAVEYAEPDCDGPDFLTTSQEVALLELRPRCWLRSTPRSSRWHFPP